MKALEMALEALKNPSVIAVQYAIHLLQEELAKPKLTNEGNETNIPACALNPKGSGMVALQQREWVGLTDEAVYEIYETVYAKKLNLSKSLIYYGVLIETKLKELNA